MNNAKVTGLRGVELGVKDLSQSIAFYQCIWGLDPVVSEGDTVYLRANGSEHHIVTLRERPKHGLLGIHFATQDRVAVDTLHAQAKAFGVKSLSAPAELPRSAGGGYGFSFQSPDGHVLNIASDVVRHPNTVSDRSKPLKLSHVVLNSPKLEEQTGFVVEYTTEVQQVDESTYMPNDAKYWREFPMRPCRWGMAGHPSNRLKAAFGGDTSVAYAEDGKRCEEIMAKTLGR